MRTRYHRLAVVAAILMFFVPAAVWAQGSPNIELLAQINQYPQYEYSDCWGYTDENGHEYALLGVGHGLSIVHISNPDNIHEVAFVPGAHSNWKDIKVYHHYAYVVSEMNNKVQIIDLSGLPNNVQVVASPPVFDSEPHNIFIDVDAGILYGAEDFHFNEAVRVISLADPVNPQPITDFGPDAHDLYAADDVLFSCEATNGTIGIYDMSTPYSPALITRLEIPSAGYVHNTWVSKDNRFMISTEETNGRTVKLWNINDLGDVTLISEYLGPGGLAHNAYLKGDYAYISHYSDGLRILNIEDPWGVFEEAYYDTYLGPGGDFDGAWGAYPFFRSGKVLISDMYSGLYVVYFEGAREPDDNDPNAPEAFTVYSDYETPSSVQLEWEDPTNYYSGDTLVDFSIDIFREDQLVASVQAGLESYVDEGLQDGSLYHYAIYARDSADSLSFGVEDSTFAGGSPIPAAPQNLACVEGMVAAILTWEDPTTQADGTPLDDLEEIRVYRDGEFIGTVPAGIGTYMDNPVPGFSYEYQLTAVDNEYPQNESAFSNSIECFIGETPHYLVWVGPDVQDTSAASGDSLFDALIANGQSAVVTNDLFAFGDDLSIYDAVFAVLGVFPNNHMIENEGPEALALESYLDGGGNLYLEGGDCYNYDPLVGGHNVHPWFGLGIGDDGEPDIAYLQGYNDLDGYTFAYEGENNWMDELNAVQSTIIWRNADNNEVSGVFFEDQQRGSRSLGLVPSFGGMSGVSEIPIPENVVIGKNTPKPHPAQVNLERSQIQPRNITPRAAHDVLATPQFPSIIVDADGKGRFVAANKAELMAAYLQIFGTIGDFPNMHVYPNVLNFGTVEVGTDSTLRLFIYNSGLADLNIGNIITSNSAFYPDTTNFVVNTNRAHVLPIHFNPSIEGDFADSLMLYSNDPDDSVYVVQLFGAGDGINSIDESFISTQFFLDQNYPNPFNPQTVISFHLPVASNISLTVFDLSGRKVRELASGQVGTGVSEVVWDGTNLTGQRVSSGVYIYRLMTEQGFTQSRKMLLVR